MIHHALTEGLGHDVEKLQENQVTRDDIKEAMDWNDLFIWVRTPTFLRVPDSEMFELLQNSNARTLAIHLDKFFGIPEREALIGKIPFWKCGHVFTADGSKQEEFKALRVNHFWMKPAVSEIYCHPGWPRDEYHCDVGFVGSRAYHDKEYPFRRRMIDFLEKTYGDRFRIIEGGVRGHALNDAYASMKVVVGDCLDSGIPYYWSDRLPETCGRHGFLIHPQIEGLDIPVIRYKPQNLEHLADQIEVTLAHPEARKAITKECARLVKEHHTWTVRLKEILEIVL